MWNFYSTPVEVLYLILSLCIAFLTLFLVLILWKIFRILRGINTITDRAKDTVDIVNHYLWQPIKFAMSLIQKTKAKANDTIQKTAKEAREKDKE